MNLPLCRPICRKRRPDYLDGEAAIEFDSSSAFLEMFANVYECMCVFFCEFVVTDKISH